MLWCAAAVAQQSALTVQEKLGYPPSARLLIIHADDLGMSHTVNRATLEALEQGWITSASIMVPCPWFPQVARWARQHPEADLGIHLVLNSEWEDFRWGPVAPADKVASLLDAAGYFPLDPVLLGPAKSNEVQTELRAQIDRARAAGVRISHLDTHMAALLSSPPLFQVYQQLGRNYRLPLLMERTGTFRVPLAPVADGELRLDRVISMEPGLPAQGWPEWYEKTLAPLKPGVYEVIVHLAYDDPEMRGATRDHPDWGAAWRQSDLDMVRSQRFQQFLHDQDFKLIKWSDLAKALPAAK